MTYQTLAFAIHSRCNASCEMCCFKCNPNREESLDEDRIKNYIDEARELSEIKTISFTGGEPFLKYEKLLRLVKYASFTGKRVTTVSNGYWGKTEEQAFSKLKPLVDCGLKHLSISYDSYHAEFVSASCIRNVLNAAKKLYLPTTLAIVKIKNEKIGKIINSLDSALSGTQIEIVSCLPAGAAKMNFNDLAFDRDRESHNQRCVYGGNLVVTFDGSIYPCCSQTIFDTQLSIGNWNNFSLKEAIYRLENNSLLFSLRNMNMNSFIEFANSQLGMNIPKYVVSPCEICSYLFDKKIDLMNYQDIVTKNIITFQNRIKN